jgi:hypothetical protein
VNAVRGLLRDLVERKLWPLAVLLLAAAVAVPIYLGRPAADAAVAPTAQQANAPKPSKAAVSIEDPAADDDRPGGVRNPFKQLHVPKPAAATADPKTPAPGQPSTSGGSSGSGGSGGDGSQPPLGPSGSGGSGSGGSGSGGSGDGNPTPKPAGDPLDVYHLSLRFGRAEASQLTTYHDVARLSPLPTADNPFFVYTGVLKDAKTAVFLLSSDATATGDGHCKPSPKSCQTIEVKEGDTEFFDLTVGGEAVQYQLDVVRVFKKGASSAVAAAASHERHSDAGADLLRRAHRRGSSSFKGAASYRWLPDSGVLVRTPQHGKARASVNGAAAASPADAASALPGVPVWRWAVGA